MTGFDSKRDAVADKLQEPWNEDEWRRNNWRCGHGWLRGEQCESCNAAQPPSEWAGIKAILDEYGLQAIDFVADFKAALEQPAQEPVREALKLALITLEGWDNHDKWVWPETALEQAKRNTKEAITAIKEAFAQPAQEPDAYQSGYHDGKKAARARCIELVLAGSSMPIQTRTLEALQRDRKRIAKLIEEDGKP